MMASPLDLDLISVDAKFEWAVMHYASVQAEIDTWFASSIENRITYEPNMDRTEHLFRAHFGSQPPALTRWSLMIGDCITNLRDCLDLLVWSVGQVSPGEFSESSRHRSAFVIAESEKAWKNAQGKLRCLPGGVCDAVSSLQPFRAADAERPTLLEVLRTLSNGNKHHLLSLAVIGIMGGRIELYAKSGKRQTATYKVTETAINEGDIIASVKFPESDPSIELRSADIDVQIAIRTKLPQGKDMISYSVLITGLIKEVAGALDAIRNSS